jgi:DNA-binding GntR family transcriptional regulator
LQVLEQTQQIIRKKLHEQVYELFKQDILEQRIGFGEKITNRDLQERYGVSSSPARDAMNRLYLEGFLDEISQGGARIVTFDYKRAIDANELMFILNKEAVFLMIDRADAKAVIHRMEGVLKRQSENLATELYYKYDYQFHHIFFDFCDNSQLIRLYSQYSGIWQLLLNFYHTDNVSRGTAVMQHIKIKDAYQKHDIKLLQSLLKTHFDDAAYGLKNILQHP